MIIRLLIFICIYSAPIFFTGYLGFKYLINPKLKLLREHKQGQLHADNSCNVCNGYLNPGSIDSIFQSGKWFHRSCFNKLLGELDD
jgi:hypothetical protein